MRNTIILIAILVSSLSTMAQDITNTLGGGGKFTIETTSVAETHVLRVEDRGRIGVNVKPTDVLTSSFNVFGSLTYMFRDIPDNTDFDFLQSDYMVYVNTDATGTLPSATDTKGRLYMVLRDISSSLTLESTSPIEGEVLQDNPSSLYSYIYSDGASWYVYAISSSNDSGLNPGYVVNIETVTGDFEITGPETQLFHVNGGGKTSVTLPSAKDVKGIIYTITLIEDFHSGGNLDIIPTGGELINGGTSGSVTNVLYVFIYSDGVNWWAFGNRGDAASKSVMTNFDGDALLETNSDIHTFEANFTENNQSYTLTLPSVVDNKGNRITIKRNADGVVHSGNVLNLKPADTESIDDIPSSSSYVMNVNFESVTVESNGIIWMIVNQVNH